MTDEHHRKGNAPLAGEANQEAKLNDPIIEVAEKLGNTQMTWTVFPDVSGKTMTVENGTWAELIERLRAVGKFKQKTQCPLFKCASFGSKRSDKGSLRHNDNVKSISGVVCDYDGEQIKLEDSILVLEKHGIRAALYPSPSSTFEKPRWRLVCPLEKACPPDAHEALVARLNGALAGILAAESFTLSQAYYFGELPENQYRVVLTFGDPSAGQCIDTLDELDDLAIGKEKTSKNPEESDCTDPFQDRVGSDTIADLRSALCALRADDRNLWINIGHALKTLGDQGRGLWLEWSQTSQKYSPEDASKWDSFTPSRTGYKSVFTQAQAASWLNPRAKVQPSAQNVPWPEIGDPFAQHVVPPFPIDALPKPLAFFCLELSVQSGFDVGAYAFALLVAASSLIDQRRKIKAGPIEVPAFLWGGLVAKSGGGKTPTLSAVTKKIRTIDTTLVRESNRQTAHWQAQCQMASNTVKPPRPPWRQLVASDITVEALAALLQDNPSGVLLAPDEMTEFIGRMDAYSGNGVGSKDRGIYLRAYDGGPQTVNRKTAGNCVIDNFSLGILTGIQPEKLAELFKKSGGGS